MHERLDNPVWHALLTRHARFAMRNGRASRYPEDVSPLAALAEPSPAALAELASIVPTGGVVGIVDIESLAAPPDVWQPAGEALPLVQMLCEAALEATDLAVVRLGEADVPEMLSLVEATQPGPFRERTIAMGCYVGVRIGGRLVAMAGERVSLEGYTEVSAVCTEPTFRGRGLGGKLVRRVGARIQAAGDAPFLHVLASNTSAIALYEQLGFRERRRRPLTVLRRVPTPERVSAALG